MNVPHRSESDVDVADDLTLLHLHRDTLGDFDGATRREWLVTNGIGGFASGSVAGANTRRYHGILVAALHPPVGRTVMVAKFDVTALTTAERIALTSTMNTQTARSTRTAIADRTVRARRNHSDVDVRNRRRATDPAGLDGARTNVDLRAVRGLRVIATDPAERWLRCARIATTTRRIAVGSSRRSSHYDSGVVDRRVRRRAALLDRQRPRRIPVGRSRGTGISSTVSNPNAVSTTSRICSGPVRSSSISKPGSASR